MCLSACLSLACGYLVLAQSPGPQPVPMPPPIAAPVDAPYPGTIQVQVDATDIERHIFSIHETVPVRGGQPIVLLYPQWWPGHHSPVGRADLLAGLVVRAGGKRVEWVRDPVQVFAFHVNVPAAANALDLDFQFTSPVEGNEGRMLMTPDMLSLQWTSTTLYPAGFFARQITVEPSVRLPDGWQFATALETQSANGSETTFKAVPYETLIDSPMLAGRYFKRLELDPGGAAPVRLDIAADRPELLEVKAEQLEVHRALVQQAYKLFGARHYSHYDFLFSLSDKLGGIGLEHHQSSEDGTIPGYFTEWDRSPDVRNLLAHEFTHSWNGKFRRPADLWTPNFNVKMQDDLLWVYEGLTDYWCSVLTARSGLWTPEQFRDTMANIDASMSERTGRAWRSLQDTADAAPLTYYGGGGWANWRRGTDFYPEGQLLWLDVDTKIRELSGGKHSLDDFAHAFYGMENGSYVTKTYTFDDVVNTLNQVQPFDWAKFLRARLDYTGAELPEHGITRGGWKLVYTDQPNAETKAMEGIRHGVNLAASIGLSASKTGNIYDVQWNGPAFKAGLVPGLTIVAVDGKDYSPDALKDAITAAKTGNAPIELLVKNVDIYSTAKIDYHGGLRYPHLERAGGKDLLGAIAAPRK